MNNRGIITAIVIIVLAVIAIILGNLFLKYILGANIDKIPSGTLAFFHALVFGGVAYLAVKSFSSK